MRDTVMYMGEQFEVVATAINDKGTTVTLERVFPPPKPKQDIRDYCREHRVWAAKDDYCLAPNAWCAYVKKPSMERKRWYGGNFITSFSPHNSTFPDCPWDKSLIAPDGSMPLMEQTRTYTGTATITIVGKTIAEQIFGEGLKTKLALPSRGDPIFVWDDEASDRIPASVRYFHSFNEETKWPIRVFCERREGAEVTGYNHFRPFDPALVGVARRDWSV